PLHGGYISDMTFTDTLTGFAATVQDSSGIGSVLKTTNGGDNWSIKHQVKGSISKIQFLNTQTGFIGGADLFKTTNAGENWFALTPLPKASFIDISVVSESEIWATDYNALIGGLYRSTNGGMNWQMMFFNAFRNPSKIYMYNSRLGFMIYSNKLYRTSNSGQSWDSVPGQRTFYHEIKMIDSLTGWKAAGNLTKTTDGGFTWQEQFVPFQSASSGASDFSIINKDTLWMAGGAIGTTWKDFRSVAFKTTNGGANWGYQILNSSINSYIPFHIMFVNANYGWTYIPNNTGFHTKVGGNDTTIYVGVQQISIEVPENFKLYQNYPNPFNPVTKIHYELRNTDYIKLFISDITGKEVSVLINQKQTTGKYEYTFDGSYLSSGIYFYTLQTNSFKQTKKMLLLK
nr:T9SS type A sorting domain-containing protein [Ignavibacteria bacterium]